MVMDANIYYCANKLGLLSANLAVTMRDKMQEKRLM